MFILNGQLDVCHKLFPSLTNLMHTYQGNIEGTCLTSKETFVGSIYEECYTAGIVSEGLFDVLNVPKDHTSTGDIVNRDVSISPENWQQAKVLTSSTQIQERLELLHQKKMDKYRKQLLLYTAGEKVHAGNLICELKIAQSFVKIWNASQITANPIAHDRELVENDSNFSDIAIKLTYDLSSTVKHLLSKSDLESFIKAQTEPQI